MSIHRSRVADQIYVVSDLIVCLAPCVPCYSKIPEGISSNARFPASDIQMARSCWCSMTRSLQIKASSN